jgi:hypothetical protein
MLHPGVIWDTPTNAFTIEPWLAKALVKKKSVNDEEFDKISF